MSFQGKLFISIPLIVMTGCAGSLNEPFATANKPMSQNLVPEFVIPQKDLVAWTNPSIRPVTPDAIDYALDFGQVNKVTNGVSMLVFPNYLPFNNAWNTMSDNSVPSTFFSGNSVSGSYGSGSLPNVLP